MPDRLQISVTNQSPNLFLKDFQVALWSTFMFLKRTRDGFEPGDNQYSTKNL